MKKELEENNCVLCGKKADILSEEDDLYYCIDTEKRVNSANKNYKRGFFDGIHNAKAKIKELIE